MAETLKSRIEELNRELALLIKEHDVLNVKAQELAKNRNNVHEEMKKLRAEAKKLKEKRDRLNEKVQKLKYIREQSNVKRGEKHTEILKLKEKIRVLIKQKPIKNLPEIEKEINTLEWTIQTTPLTVEKEKVIVDQVRKLALQRSIHKKIQKMMANLIELQTEEKASETKARSYHKELLELAERSQKNHVKLLDVREKILVLQNKADDVHQKYVEARKQAGMSHQKYVELSRQITPLKQDLNKSEGEKQAKRQKELKEKILRKLDLGEKLTWEEYKFISE